MSWVEVGRVAARQYGIVTNAQMRREGMTEEQIKVARRQGRILGIHLAVYRVAGAPDTPEGRALAAVFAAGRGAAASHATAAWLWGLVPDPPERPEVTVPLPRYARLVGVDVHRATELDARWVRARRGIPATDPLRTMLVLGASLARHDVVDALERGVIAGLFSVAALEWVRAELAERGRNGCGVLRGILDDRALGAARPDGMLEPRMAQLCARHGVERPVFQHRVVDGSGALVAKVDFAYPDVRAFLEVDGYEIHGTPQAMEADFDRQNRLVALGWVPIRFGWRRLVRQPRLVAEQINEVLAQLRSG